MKSRLFAIAMFAILLATGAWSHSTESRCSGEDVKVTQGGFGIIAE